MIDTDAALEAVVAHVVEFEDEFEVIEPTFLRLVESGDVALVPRLHEVLAAFLDDGNAYGRDLIAGVLAGIQGVAALPVLLGASTRDLGDDQDGLQDEIVGLLEADPVAARAAVLEFAGAGTAAVRAAGVGAAEVRRAGVWALGYVAEPEDIALFETAAADGDAEVRALAVGSVNDPAADERAFQLIVGALRDGDEGVRAAAVSALGATGRADATAHLETLASDPVPRVRDLVAFALGRLRDSETQG